NAISNYFHRERLDRNTVYRYSLDRKNVDNKELNHVFQNGYYFLIKYDYEIKKIINGRESRFTHLKSLAINLNGEEFFSYDSENSDFFSSVCQQHKTSMPEEGSNIEFTDDLMKEIKRYYTLFMLAEKETLEENEKLKFVSELSRKTKQEISDVVNRLKSNHIRLENERNRILNEGASSDKKGSIENIINAEIRELRERKEKLETFNQESTISVANKLISLSFVYVHG